MLDRALQEHLRELRSQPDDLPRWVDLIYHLRRLRRDPGRLELLPLLPGLLEARTSKTTITRVDRILADLYGVQVMRGPHQTPPEFWSHTQRTEEVEGVVRDTRTRLPLHLRRLRDRALMALVPEGVARLGGPGEEPGPREATLPSYYLDVQPVPGAKLQRFRSYKPRGVPGRRRDWKGFGDPTRDRFPAIEVSWVEAEAYAAWAGARLPTEDEWERAARRDAPELTPAAQTSVIPLPEGIFGHRGLLAAPGEWCADWRRPQGTRAVRGLGPGSAFPSWTQGVARFERSTPLTPWERAGRDPAVGFPEVGFRLATSF